MFAAPLATRVEEQRGELTDASAIGARALTCLPAPSPWGRGVTTGRVCESRGLGGGGMGSLVDFRGGYVMCAATDGWE